jgi:sterol desaturase/sphingolipid hydroxylase (fatty acid hydroxylase superfamily)
MESINYILATKLFFLQIGYSLIGLFILFLLFEVVPLIWGAKNTIRKNLLDFLKYQVGRGIYAVCVGAFFVVCIHTLGLNIGFVDLTHLSHFSQALIIYFFVEFVIYLAHMLSHKRNIPILTSSHRFHHTVTNDMEWVNSKKEHLLVIALFLLIFTSMFFVVFKSSGISHIMVTSAYLFFNSLSHYRVPFTIPYLDQIFLFPKDHLTHHTVRRSGPYGVTMSLFDTIFNTRS